MFKKNKKRSPIMTYIILTFLTILLSGFLSLLNVQAEYSTINKATGTLINNVIEVKNLFSVSGLKHIFTTAVSGFVNFEPLSTLIIVLIGIGVLEKTGFTKTFFTILTKNMQKNTVTFTLIFICLLFSLVGNIGYAIMLPLGALLFKYGHRNPLGGIIATFASLSFGTGINIFLSATDSSLLTLTLEAAKVVDLNYAIGIFFSLFIMIVALIAVSIVFTNITEKNIMPKLPRYESDEEEIIITNKELRGLIIGLGCGILYTLIIIYMIIPGLPLSGALLDSNATKYIDMLFGADSLFNKGFIFIVTLCFVIIGLGYGIMTKNIKNSKDISESLAYSLDDIGGILVLIFFASLFVNVFAESQIGEVIIASLSGLISGLNFTGIWLILILILILALTNLLCTDTLTKWAMLSATVVPLLMNASISPEYSQIIYTAADSMTNGLTPVFIYFVVYVAFLEKYSKHDVVSLFGSAKYMIPYSVYTFVIWTVILVGWYMIGVPIGIGSLPGVVYGA